MAWAECALRSAHSPAEAFVRVSHHGAVRGRPYKLEVRAATDFKKGQLCLVPHGGTLMHSRDIGGIQSALFAHGMINRVPVTVRTVTKGS